MPSGDRSITPSPNRQEARRGRTDSQNRQDGSPRHQSSENRRRHLEVENTRLLHDTTRDFQTEEQRGRSSRPESQASDEGDISAWTLNDLISRMRDMNHEDAVTRSNAWLAFHHPTSASDEVTAGYIQASMEIQAQLHFMTGDHNEPSSSTDLGEEVSELNRLSEREAIKNAIDVLISDTRRLPNSENNIMYRYTHRITEIEFGRHDENVINIARNAGAVMRTIDSSLRQIVAADRQDRKPSRAPTPLEAFLNQPISGTNTPDTTRYYSRVSAGLKALRITVRDDNCPAAIRDPLNEFLDGLKIKNIAEDMWRREAGS